MLKCPQVLDQLHCTHCPLISCWQGRFLEPLVLIAPLCFKLKQKSLFSGLGPFPSSTISFSGPHPMTENVSKRFQGRVKSSQVRALIISCDSFSPLANDRRTSPQLTDYQISSRWFKLCFESMQGALQCSIVKATNFYSAACAVTSAMCSTNLQMKRQAGTLFCLFS